MFSSYLNLAITLGPPISNGYLLTVRGPGGDARGALILPASERYQSLFADLQSFRSDEQAIIEIGQILFRAIFQGSIRDVYIRTQGMLAEGQGLRLTIDADTSDGAVGALPWELLYDPDQGPLALLDTPVVRYLPQQSRIPTLKTDLPLKVLLTSAQTVAMTEAGQELEAVRQALDGLGAFVQIVVEPHLTVERLQRRLREGFHVWHFVGQSDFDTDGMTGRLAFEDDQGSIEYLTAPELAILLRGSDIRLVVLDAGQSGRLATKPLRSIAPALVRARVSAVIAMQFAAAEAITHTFAREFYQALVEGFPIDACVTEGRKAIMQISGLGGIDWGIPVVYSRASDGMLFDLPALPKPRCPYPGMVPFRAADAHFFCGRKAEIRQLLLHLRNQRRLFVIGPSGSGKSSLINAGLLPCLIASSLFPAGFWRLRSIRPGNLPMEALRQAIGDLSRPAQAIANLLATHPPARRILLVVDQLEELFVQASRDDQRSFHQALRALEAISEVTILCAMRADFYPDLMNSDLWPIDASQRVEIAPLRGEGLREAIEQPAKDVGVRLEPGLVERLLSDAADEPGVLPLIQETMVLLWDMMPGRLLPINIYTQLGSAGRSGLAVAIASKADATLEQLRPAEQTIARRIFLRLIQFGEGRADTRRQQLVSALRANTDDPAQFERTLRHLTDNRLLTLSGSASAVDRMADIAHEALIGGWPRLQRWLAERRDAEQTRRRLEAKATEWVRLGRSNGGLLDEAELPEAERWLASDDAVDLGQNALLPALVHASRSAIGAAKKAQEQIRRREIAQAQALAAEQAQRAATETRRAEEQAQSAKRLRQRAIYLAGALLLALIGGIAAGIFGVFSQLNADEARHQTQIAVSRQLAAQALYRINDQLDLALLLGAEAFHMDGGVQSRGSLLSSLGYSPHLVQFLRDQAGPITSITLSPDGRFFATGSQNGTAILRDAKTYRPLGPALQAFDKSEGIVDPISSLTFNADGTTLVSISCGRVIACEHGDMRRWDVVSRQQIDAPLWKNRLSGGGTSLAFSPDGRTLAVGTCGMLEGGSGLDCYEGEVQFWDISRQHEIRPSLKGHKDEILSLAFSPDGAILATSGSRKDGTVILWDIAKGMPLGEPLKVSDGAVWQVAFSPDGRLLAAAGNDATIRLWDVATHLPIGQPLIGHTKPVRALAFSPDGTILATGGANGDDTIRLWDVATLSQRGTPLRGQSGGVNSIIFTADGNRLISGGGNGTLVWDVETKTPFANILKTDHGTSSIAFSPDGKTLAAAGDDGYITLWEVATHTSLGKPLKLPGEYQTFAGYLFFTPDGKRLVTRILYDLVIWNLDTRQPIPAESRKAGPIGVMALSPDGKMIARNGAGTAQYGGASIWDIAKQQYLDNGKGMVIHAGRSTSMAFSPDGRLLATGGVDGTIVIWDVATGETAVPMMTGHLKAVRALSFSQNGTLLASGGDDAVVRVWNVSTGQPYGTPLAGHTDSISGLTFSPDSGTLISSSKDGTFILWDVQTLQSIGRPIQADASGIAALALTSDGRIMATGSGGSQLTLWSLDVATWQSLACQIANRNLSKAEWDQFIGTSTPYKPTCPDLPSGEGAPQTTP
jgi:WD40 repeat protein